MARIKFLDVLEETKRKPSLNYDEDRTPREPSYRDNLSDEHGFRQSSVREDNTQQASFREPSSSVGSFSRERTFRERGTSAEPRLNRSSGAPSSFAPRRTEKVEQEETNTKVIWIASLFVFLGGILFLGGYWMGHAFKRDMPADRINIENAVAPSIPLDPAPVPLMNDPVSQPAAPTTKPIPVIKPVGSAEPVKKTPAKTATKASTPVKANSEIGNGEFVIQVSAHTSIEAARVTEQRLLDSGIKNVYISENYMGDNQKIFRVRVRNGFRSEAEAKKALPAIRTAVGLADNDGRIIKLN